jgi:hypothetical protein
MTRYAILGVAIWAAATIALRIIGSVVFEHPIALFLVSLIAMITLAVLVLPNGDAGVRAAIALATPGMLLDTISAVAFARVFPNIPADAAGLFGGWLLFCNAVVLVAALALRPAATRDRAAGGW